MNKNVFALLLLFVVSMMFGTSTAAATGDDQDAACLDLNFCDSSNAQINIMDISSSDGIKYSITVKLGTTIKVNVKGNPTTGYSQKMTVCPSDSIVKAINTEPEYIPDPHEAMMVGYGGVYTFTFSAVGLGITTTTIEYARYFEKPPKCIFKTEIKFIVTDKCEDKGASLS